MASTDPDEARSGPLVLTDLAEDVLLEIAACLLNAT